MTTRKRLLLLGSGLMAAMMIFGAATALANVEPGQMQSSGQSSIVAADPGDEDSAEVAFPGRGPRAMNGRGPDIAALAKTLGVSVEELEAAFSQIRDESISKALAEGLITADQAEQMLECDCAGIGFGHRLFAFADEGDGPLAALAAALGVEVNELQERFNHAHEARLAEMVAEGRLTQEQADKMLELGPRFGNAGELMKGYGPAFGQGDSFMGGLHRGHQPGFGPSTGECDGSGQPNGEEAGQGQMFRGRGHQGRVSSS